MVTDKKNNDKHRFVINIEKDTLEKLKKLAEKEKRATSNLARKIINDYVDNNY